MKKLSFRTLLKTLNIKNIHQQQNGQILVLASILLLLSSLMVIPLAYHVNTGIKTTQVYQRDTKDIYAADAGIQYGMWKIKYDPTIIADRNNNVYGTYSYSYNATSDLRAIDNNNISVTVSANWLFYYLFRLAEGSTPHDVNLTTTYTASNGVFDINFLNSQQPGGPPVQPTVIQSMGVWLPPGFGYAGGSSGITTSPPTINPVYGGINLIWNNVGYSLGKYQSATQQFNYSPAGYTPSGAASWVFPQQQSIGASWDNAIWWYTVNSTAIDNSNQRNTTIQSTVISNTGLGSNLILVTYEIQ